jgi:putative DNA primase/helicase
MEAVTAMTQLRQHARRIADERVYQFTELGNAERLAQRFGDRLRYVAEWGAWLENDGKRWQRDKVGAATIAAKSIVRELYAEGARLAKGATADDEGPGKQAATVVRWARSSSRANAIRAMVSLAQSEPPIAATADAFDRDPFAFNVENGTIDLRTGTLRPHCADDMITRLAPVAYDPDATCPIWDGFLERCCRIRRFVPSCSASLDMRSRVMSASRYSLSSTGPARTARAR